MITVKQALKIFTKRFPELTVLRCVDYADDFYVLEAVEDQDAIDYNSPYYALSKTDGRIMSFAPNLDLDAFFDAVENRTVYSTY